MHVNWRFDGMSECFFVSFSSFYLFAWNVSNLMAHTNSRGANASSRMTTNEWTHRYKAHRKQKKTRFTLDHCVVALALRLLLMISLERSIRMFFVITEHVRTERGRTIAHIHIVHIHAVLSCCLPVRVWVSDDLQTDFDFSVITQLFSSLSLALFRFEGFQVMKIDSMNFTASFRIREIEILSIDRHFFVFTLWTRLLRGQRNAIWSFIDIWSMKKKKKARRKCQSISFSDSVSSNVVVCVYFFSIRSHSFRCALPITLHCFLFLAQTNLPFVRVDVERRFTTQFKNWKFCVNLPANPATINSHFSFTHSICGSQ